MGYERFVEEVCERGAFASREEAERAITATLVVVGRSIEDRDAREIADQLPRPLASIFDALEYTGDRGVDEIVAAVAEREGLELGFAREHVEVVCRALGRLLPASIRLRLPPRLGLLFEPIEPPPALTPHPMGHTLANGRAGSTHPLSEARLASGQPSSVAQADDPHGGRKLSGGRPGSRETLATGRPASAHPLAGDDEED